MESPLVSVIVPTYNRAAYLAEAVDSVLNQSYPHLELLVVDDGSTDNTRDVLNQFAGDRRLHVTYQANAGQSRARNAALAQAQGDFFCFLDSDNVWVSDKLQVSLDAFRDNPDVDVVYGDIITINENGEELSRRNMRRFSGAIVAEMLKDNCVTMNTAMFRRRCYLEQGGMSETRRVADDYDLWLRYSVFFQFLYLPRFLAKYRVMEDQISSDKSARFESNFQILADFEQQYGAQLGTDVMREGWTYFFLRRARYHADVGMPSLAVRDSAKALSYCPWRKNSWRSLVRSALIGTRNALRPG
jgi:glycosyltransferase involved in cell wall biosynthesis